MIRWKMTNKTQQWICGGKWMRHRQIDNWCPLILHVLHGNIGKWFKKRQKLFWNYLTYLIWIVDVDAVFIGHFLSYKVTRSRLSNLYIRWWILELQLHTINNELFSHLAKFISFNNYHMFPKLQNELVILILKQIFSTTIKQFKYHYELW